MLMNNSPWLPLIEHLSISMENNEGAYRSWQHVKEQQERTLKSVQLSEVHTRKRKKTETQGADKERLQTSNPLANLISGMS